MEWGRSWAGTEAGGSVGRAPSVDESGGRVTGIAQLSLGGPFFHATTGGPGSSAIKVGLVASTRVGMAAKEGVKMPTGSTSTAAAVGARHRSRLHSIPSKLRAAPARVPSLLRAMTSEPVETLLCVPEQVSHWRHRPVPYQAEEDWGPSLHRALGLPWPCPESHVFGQLWLQMLAELTAKRMAVGRWTTGIYSDADSAMAGTVWCAVRHLKPRTILETGVARGLTSRVVLEAMALNGTGHLWSIDLPYLFGTRESVDQTGAAVPDSFGDQWTYVRGSSRRRLEPLLSQLEAVDVFIHDSLHTVRNMRFEMDTVWPILSGGGLMVIDDVDTAAFRDFTRETRHQNSMVYRSGDGPWMFGVVLNLEDDPPAIV
jgi:Methyltransferase domain